MKDYIAIMLIAGGSSYGRAATVDRAVDICARTAVDDWSSLFHLEGVPALINVYDVTNCDKVWWDARGVHAIWGDGEVSIDRLELREVVLPKRKNRRR